MRFVRAYDYVDESGVLLFQVVRWEPKTFSQRHPDGRGGWKRVSNGKLTMAGCRMVPYRLDLLAAAATKLAEHGWCRWHMSAKVKRTAIDYFAAIVSRRLPLAARASGTPNSHGTLKTSNVFCSPTQRRRRAAAYGRGRSVAFVGRVWVKIVQLPVENKGGDFSDWANAGGTRLALKALIAATPALTLADLPPPTAMPKRPAARLPDRLSPYAEERTRSSCQSDRCCAAGAAARKH